MQMTQVPTGFVQQHPTPKHQPPLHQASDLTEGGILAHIQLADQLYTLRITRSGKLILTK